MTGVLFVPGNPIETDNDLIRGLRAGAGTRRFIAVLAKWRDAATMYSLKYRKTFPGPVRPAHIRLTCVGVPLQRDATASSLVCKAVLDGALGSWNDHGLTVTYAPPVSTEMCTFDPPIRMGVQLEVLL